jgi:hypothetical protein
MQGKYIIKVVRGHEVAILFDSLINHCDIGTCKDSRGETVAAGFFAACGRPTSNDERDISVSAFGKSESLEIKSRGDIDEPLIKKVLRKY